MHYTGCARVSLGAGLGAYVGHVHVSGGVEMGEDRVVGFDFILLVISGLSLGGICSELVSMRRM